MTQNFSWEGSFGSQLLAEISLLEAQAKTKGERTIAPRDSIQACTFGSQLLAEISLLEAQAKVQNNGTTSKKESVQVREQTTVPEDPQDVCDRTADAEVSNFNLPVNIEHNVTREAAASPSLFSQNSFDVSSKLEVSERVETKPVTNSVINSPLSCSTPVINMRKESIRQSSTAKLQLQNWDLPAAVVKSYGEKKITSLFPWQVECLTTGQVLKGSNLIYSAPTSSGKTLVAELLMLKTAFDQKKKGKIITNIFKSP